MYICIASVLARAPSPPHSLSFTHSLAPLRIACISLSCNTLRHTATYRNILQHTTAAHYRNIPQYTATHYRSTLPQHTAIYHNTLPQHTTAAYRNILQHTTATNTATRLIYCNILQHTTTTCTFSCLDFAVWERTHAWHTAQEVLSTATFLAQGTAIYSWTHCDILWLTKHIMAYCNTPQQHTHFPASISLSNNAFIRDMRRRKSSQIVTSVEMPYSFPPPCYWYC